MEVSFRQLCAADAATWETLRRRIDESAAQGWSYEFDSCLLPPGCRPERVRLGFSRQRDGTYLLYWRPTVDYLGPSRVLWTLFRTAAWRFDTFSLLMQRMGALHRECAPAPLQTAAQPWPPLYRSLVQALGQEVVCQPWAVQAAAFRLAAHLGKQAPLRPLSLVFHGPTGVGKSELGKAIAPALCQCCGQPYSTVWVDMNSYTHPHSVHRLTGAPPGYVGYDDPSPLEAVRQAPYTVFMLDELEKAHPEVLKAFMPILDEGRCTARRPDGEGGRELDFRRCVFVFTTNLDLCAAPRRTLGFCPGGQGDAASANQQAATPQELAQRLYLSNEQARRCMTAQGVPPEIAGRFGAFAAFSPLGEGGRRAVLHKQIAALGREYGLSIVQIDPETLRALAHQPPGHSARSLVTVLEGMLCPLLIQASSAGDRPLRLTGPPEQLRLTAAYSDPVSSVTVPLPVSS